jgi:YbbR domain-containing protein
VRKKLNIFIASVIFAIILWGSISLSDIFYTNVDVKLTLTNFPQGYTTGSPLPEKIQLRVKGQGWRLVSINVGPETEFRVSVGGDSGRINISLYNYIESNRWLLYDVEIINILPDSIRFFVERIISKKLPVNSGLELEFKPGYGLASNIIFKPDSVVVTGPFSLLRKMNQIKTVDKSLSPLDSRTEIEVNLPRMNGFVYNVNLIEVILDIQRIVDKQFDNIEVNVLDIPPRKEVVLLPNKIGFNVRGGIEILGKLKPEQFRAFVRYQSLVQDTTGSVTPILEMPKNVTLQFVKPDRLRYIIRSF